MRIDPKIIEEVKRLSILDVAKKLGIQYSNHGTCRMCHCFRHPDDVPSMWLKPANNTWRCGGCGIGGDNIALVMERLGLQFVDAVCWLAGMNPIEQQKTMNNTVSLNSAYLEQCFRTDSPFCQALVANNILTDEQMHRAALRYHLGKTEDDGVIFWLIDANGRLQDGKIMFYRPDCHRDHGRHPTWVAHRLIRKKLLDSDYKAGRCLFGLHLLNHDYDHDYDPVVAVVESEKTAVICSELLPQISSPNPQPVIWMATGGMTNISEPVLSPLRGRRIILFPDTDTTGEAYNKWLSVAIEASKEFRPQITVSNYLEDKATPEQKERKIDIADYIIESQNPKL